MDELIYHGGEIKALGNGKVGGFLVMYATEDMPDLTGEFFTKNTEFFLEDGARIPVLYDHGLDPVLKRRKLGMATITRKDAGVWLEAQLEMRDDYEKAVYQLVKEKKAGWSSGAASHMADRRRTKKATEITEWGLAEASITVRPADYNNEVIPLKSYQGQPLKATWSAAFMNDLPDASFLHIESGGKKDDEGKTTPRSLRHFPYKDADGKVDVPHLRNALARIPQSSLSQNVKDSVMAKAKKLAKANGINVSDDEGKSIRTFAQNSLATVLSKHIDDRVDDGHSKESIIKSLAREAGLQVETIDAVLSDTFRANDANLKAFARVLNISFDMLKSATRRDYARTIKGMFEEALADNVPSRWQLDGVYCDLMRKIAATASASSVTGVDFDSDAKIKEATAEYMSRLQSLVIAQVNDYVESGEDEPFYLKAIIQPSDVSVSEHLDMQDHSELVASAVTEITKRFRRFNETRIKAGRVLSEKNRTRLAELVATIKQSVSDAEALLEETKPMASDEAMRAARTRHLALRTQRRESQLGA